MPKQVNHDGRLLGFGRVAVLANREGNTILSAQLLRAQAVELFTAGRIGQSLSVVRSALELSDQVHDEQGGAEGCADLAAFLIHASQSGATDRDAGGLVSLDEAGALLETSLAYFQQTGDTPWIQRVLANFASLALAQGRPLQALELLVTARESLETNAAGARINIDRRAASIAIGDTHRPELAAEFIRNAALEIASAPAPVFHTRGSRATQRIRNGAAPLQRGSLRSAPRNFATIHSRCNKRSSCLPRRGQPLRRTTRCSSTSPTTWAAAVTRGIIPSRRSSALTPALTSLNGSTTGSCDSKPSPIGRRWHAVGGNRGPSNGSGRRSARRRPRRYPGPGCEPTESGVRHVDEDRPAEAEEAVLQAEERLDRTEGLDDVNGKLLTIKGNIAWALEDFDAARVFYLAAAEQSEGAERIQSMAAGLFTLARMRQRERYRRLLERLIRVGQRAKLDGIVAEALLPSAEEWLAAEAVGLSARTYAEAIELALMQWWHDLPAVSDTTVRPRRRDRPCSGLGQSDGPRRRCHRTHDRRARKSPDPAPTCHPSTIARLQHDLPEEIREIVITWVEQANTILADINHQTPGANYPPRPSTGR